METTPRPVHLSRPAAARPYGKLLRVKLASGRTYLLSSELWNLLPKGDAVVSVIDALRLPVFAVVAGEDKPAPRRRI